MIDELFKVYLIEVNTNPCLELSCNLLNKIIPTMIEQSIRQNNFYLRIAVDPIFPPPDLCVWNLHKFTNVPDKIIENNKFELIFDEAEIYKNENK